MKWVLDGNGVTVRLKNRQFAHATVPSGQVMVRGTGCLLRGAWECYGGAVELVNSLGGTITREAIGRLVLCLDLPGVSIDPLAQAFSDGWYTTRAKITGSTESNGRSFFFGGGEKRLEVYDKLAQVAARGEQVTRQAMIDRRWGGVAPSAATRIEYQLRGDALRRLGITSGEDFFQRRPYLVEQLLSSTRITAHRPSRNNTSRARLHPLWALIDAAFRAWGGPCIGEPPRPVNRGQVPVDRHIKMAIGCIVSAAAQQDRAFASDVEFLSYGLQLLRQHLPQSKWRRRLEERRSALLVA